MSHVKLPLGIGNSQGTIKKNEFSTIHFWFLSEYFYVMVVCILVLRFFPFKKFLFHLGMCYLFYLCNILAIRKYVHF